MIDIDAMIQKEIENGYGDANAPSLYARIEPDVKEQAEKAFEFSNVFFSLLNHISE